MRDHERRQTETGEHVKVQCRVPPGPIEGHQACRPGKAEPGARDEERRGQHAEPNAAVAARDATGQRAPGDGVLPEKCGHERQAGDAVRKIGRKRRRLGEQPRDEPRRDEGAHRDEEHEVRGAAWHAKMLFRWHTAPMPERIVVTSEPLNAETPLGRDTAAITPVGRHYVRTHFPRPSPPHEIVVDGAVRNGARYDLAALQALAARTLTVTLECAGNGRAYLEPKVPGEQWRLRPLRPARWTRAPLRTLLVRADPEPPSVGRPFLRTERDTPKELPSV